MRHSLKIVGSSGQGIDSIGEIVAKGLKRSGYCVFGYREYPSLIKGGHASYQLDFSSEKIESSETKVNLVIALNHHGLEHNLVDLQAGGILVHATEPWTFSAEDQAIIERLSLKIAYLPIEDILTNLKAKPILGNVILTAFVWSIFGQKMDLLKTLVGARFRKKKDLLELNMACIDEGAAAHTRFKELRIELPKPQKKWKDQLLITGSKAMGLGAVHAGVRLYAGYPMTPSSPLLSYIADIQNETGMVIKQAEDEITAAQFVSGAMFAGTRALTATSGGGFDLMSETLSLNGIIENPTVFVLAQRPGPATGLPTWTGQADLLMAIHTAHGEFARLVLAASDAEDSFRLMPIAFNLAEQFQISVIVLTDKQIAEALYTEVPFDQTKTIIDRGNLVTDAKKLAALSASDRYDPTAKDGVSPRWLPGAKAATYAAQGDEHSPDGTVNESALNAKTQIDKRMRKMQALKEALPEPTLWLDRSQKMEHGSEVNIDVLLIGWGSTKSVIMDVLQELKEPRTVGYLHFTHLWPLKTDYFLSLATKAKKIILIEGNHQGQLGMLLKQETGIDIKDRILKYDGRPFFVDELLSSIQHILSA